MYSFIAFIRPDNTPFLSSRLSKVFVAASLLVLSCSLMAQTAHFSGSVFMRGSGFGNPDGVAVDRGGNLFVADEGTGKVYELLAAGGYTRLVTLSTQFTIPTGIAVDGNENVFVTDQGTGRVYELLAAGGYTTANQLGSGFSNPNGVAVDASGNVFVADTLNNLVKEILAVDGTIPSSNPTINTLGQANGNFDHPGSVAVDASGNVFVADTLHSLVKEIVAAGGYVTVNTLGTGFSYDNGVALDGSGNLFVVDSGHQVIKELLAAGSYTTESTLDGVFNYPANATADGSGNVYVADYSAGAIYEIMRGGVDFGFLPVGASTPGTRTLTFSFDTGGAGVTVAVSTQGAPGLDFSDAGTGSCDTNGAGYSYEAGGSCSIILEFKPTLPGTRYGAAALTNSDGRAIAVDYVYGTGLGSQVNFLPGTQSTVGSGLNDPEGVAVDSSGNVYIADTNNNQVLKEALSAGAYTQTVIVTGLSTPKGIALDGAGNLYIANTGNDQVLVETLSGGTYTQNTVGSELSSPDGVAVDGSGNVYIADSSNNRVLKETLSEGSYTQSTVTTSALNGPWRVEVDGSNNLYIADTGNSRVLKETLSGSGFIESVIVSGLGSPKGLAVDSSGNVYIADAVTNLILEEAVFAGSYSQSTIVSGLNNPKGVAVDGNGRVYIDDTLSSEVLKEDFADAPSLSFATANAGSTSPDSPQTVTLSNIGNAALVFPIPVSGDNPIVAMSFPLDGATTCPEVSSSGTAGSVAAGSSCTYAINFIPAAGGFLSGSLEVTDTNLNAVAPGYATQSISLSGTGIPAPDATHTAVSALPSPVTVGQPVTLTAVVSDTTTPATMATGDVSFTDTTGTTVVPLNGGAAVPLAAGTATLQVTSTVVGVHTITANFVGFAPEPTARVAPRIPIRQFGSSSGSVTLTVTGIAPRLSFAPIPAQKYGNPPFAVSAGSASSGAVIYTVVSGPATISGNMVTLTGAGTVVLLASQAASGSYAAATANLTFIVAAASGEPVPTLSFGPIAPQTYGNPPFAVSATSPSSGTVTYMVVSGPATISGNIVTLTGAGTVALSAGQAASGNYAAATAAISFIVAAAPVGFTLTTTAGFSVETVLPGGAAAFNLTLAPGSAPTYPDALTLGTTGLPAGATVTFSPAAIPAGSGVTPVTMTVQTVKQQTARNAKPGRSLGTMALALLLLPMAGIKPVRRRLRKMPGLPVVLAAAALSLGAMVCLSGCSSNGFFNQPAKSYTVVVTATDVVTGAHSSTNVILTVQ
jgi:sugar lactone lactonase YvrE